MDTPEQREMIQRAANLKTRGKLATYVREALLEAARTDLFAAGEPVDRPPLSSFASAQQIEKLRESIRDDARDEVRERMEEFIQTLRKK